MSAGECDFCGSPATKVLTLHYRILPPQNYEVCVGHMGTANADGMLWRIAEESGPLRTWRDIDTVATAEG